ncbi:hypothetical protein PR202_gb01572 [Eleusine coracana subsp. coracana]|uniref:WRKY domain-containing protein n=1 Tax=Eleusine coracana subsp. coracana TaxID=191504 RepID=A0AAV5DW68_ELECO|nr:hypothetical protein QOZ80_5BG0416950 [Eleusine coracana subsp. coracana]GJN14717.1 hypothetical protein PR202_gb01572 [Eleusine coracana subsp. coracana]
MATTADDTATAAASAACEVVAGARDSAVRLLALLKATGADPGRQNLAEQIIRCIDRALAAVRGADDGKKRGASVHGPAAPSSPSGFKRRMRCRGEPGTRVLSPTMDDSFAWRKYGEKTINHHSYPRFYFRCTYRDEHGCGAKKRVQQTQEDPSLFETTYFGKHAPACPRNDAPVPPVVEGTFLPQVPLLASPIPSDDKAPKVPSLPVEVEEELMQAKSNAAGLTEEYCLLDHHHLMKLVSADVSFASPAGGLVESVEDGSLEELVTLLWS